MRESERESESEREGVIIDSPGDWGLGGTTANLLGDEGRERVTSELH